MTLNILNNNDNEEIQTQNYLVNLFSLQYPHPFNWTPPCFQLYVGRLIVKLLLDERFVYNTYQDLFPREWFPHEVVTVDTMKEKISDFQVA